MIKLELLSIFDISPMSTLDGPNRRVVIFFQGCPLECAWCHSPHSQPRTAPLLFMQEGCTYCGRCMMECPNGVHSVAEGTHILAREHCTGCGACVQACPLSSADLTTSVLRLPTRLLTPESLLNEIALALRLCGPEGGVTLSGGEALLQLTGVIQFLSLCRERGIHTAVETSGRLDPAVYSAAAPWVDLWLFGLRVVTDRGQKPSYESISESLRILTEEHQADVLPRIPMIPTVMDDSEVLDALRALLARYGIAKVWLMPWNESYELYYHMSGARPRFAPPSADETARCVNRMTTYFQHNGFELCGDMQRDILSNEEAST